ncbi:MAG: hypothetical protein HY438_01390 [DPANN group archaeon]|nr:hypothetical protein [DPANN group archaeon]
MEIVAKKQLRQASADFLRVMVEKINTKEEPALPEQNIQDAAKIEQLVNQIKECGSAKVTKTKFL